LRFGLLAYCVQGRSLNLDVRRIIGYRQFCNKIWQSFKFVMTRFSVGFVYSVEKIDAPKANLLNRWILHKLNQTVKDVNSSFEAYLFGEAALRFYSFWMYDFCDVYIEASKFLLNAEE